MKRAEPVKAFSSSSPTYSQLGSAGAESEGAPPHAGGGGEEEELALGLQCSANARAGGQGPEVRPAPER